jgi:translation initiation factor 1A
LGRRYEEKVDIEELARLENPEDSSGGKIRVKMPNRKINEMFAFAEQILGGRRVTVLCEDGETRMARIPGKMRRRQWVRDGDLIIVWPWDFQDSKADVKHRYSKTQAMYLSRKGVLPKELDFFGMNTASDDDDDEFADTFGIVDTPDEEEVVLDDADADADDDDDDDEEKEDVSKDKDFFNLQNEYLKWPKFRAFLNECLRLFPASPNAMIRQLRFEEIEIDDAVLASNMSLKQELENGYLEVAEVECEDKSDTESSVYHLYNHCIVHANIMGAHLRPQEFENPLQFDIDRWLTNDGRRFTSKKCATLLTFGVGRRNCPGMTLAMKQLYMIIALLLCKYRFYIEDDDEQVFEPTFSGTLWLEPQIELKVKFRTQNEAEL